MLCWVKKSVPLKASISLFNIFLWLKTIPFILQKQKVQIFQTDLAPVFSILFPSNFCFTWIPCLVPVLLAVDWHVGLDISISDKIFCFHGKLFSVFWTKWLSVWFLFHRYTKKFRYFCIKFTAFVTNEYFVLLIVCNSSISLMPTCKNAVGSYFTVLILIRIHSNDRTSVSCQPPYNRWRCMFWEWVVYLICSLNSISTILWMLRCKRLLVYGVEWCCTALSKQKKIWLFGQLSLCSAE